MFTAAINSATHQTSVALVNNGKLLAEKSWNGNKDEAEKILPNLLTLLKKAKKKWRDLDEIFVVAGPGPFTGLRVGVTIANVLGWSTASGIRTAGVFDYLASRLPLKMAQNTAILIKGGGDNIALMLPKAKKEQLISIENLSSILKKAKVKNILAEMKSKDLSSLQKILKAKAGWRFEQKRLKTNAGLKFIPQKSLKTFGKTVIDLLKKSKKSKLVKPLYLQKPHITQSKKEVFAHAK